MKVKSTLLFLVFIVTSSLFAEEAKKLYKWTDAQGNVHFSDQPQKGATEIEMKLAPSTKMHQADLSKLKTNDISVSDPLETAGYQSLVLSNPADGGVIRSNEGSVTLAANLSPEIASGHEMRFFLDGGLLKTDPGATSVTTKNVGFGKHSASVIVVDAAGKTQMTSETIHFELLNRINPEIKKKQKASRPNN